MSNSRFTWRIGWNKQWRKITGFWGWQVKNLPIITAAMILSKHLKLDLKCLGESECLLSSNANQFIPCLAFPRREGAYLHFDYNRGIFIRSGKVVRHSFQSRHDEHLAASKEDKSPSHFYFMYPSKEGKRKDKHDKLGCFKDLTQIIWARFDPASGPAMQVIKNYNEGGLLIRAPQGARAYPWILSKYFPSVRACVRACVRPSVSPQISVGCVYYV